MWNVLQDKAVSLSPSRSSLIPRASIALAIFVSTGAETHRATPASVLGDRSPCYGHAARPAVLLTLGVEQPLLSVLIFVSICRATTSGPLPCFTPQSYYLRSEQQGQVCAPRSSVLRFVAERQSPLPHWSARRHFGGSVKQKQ